MTKETEKFRPQESFFQIVDYLIEEAHFQIEKHPSSSRLVYNLELKPEYGEIKPENDRIFTDISLEVFIKGEQDQGVVQNIFVKIRGNFEAKGQVDEQLFNQLCRLNGIMNLLLIARSFIATATSQMGVQPVIVPLVKLLPVKIEKD